MKHNQVINDDMLNWEILLLPAHAVLLNLQAMQCLAVGEVNYFLCLFFQCLRNVMTPGLLRIARWWNRYCFPGQRMERIACETPFMVEFENSVGEWRNAVDLFLARRNQY